METLSDLLINESTKQIVQKKYQMMYYHEAYEKNTYTKITYNEKESLEEIHATETDRLLLSVYKISEQGVSIKIVKTWYKDHRKQSVFHFFNDEDFSEERGKSIFSYRDDKLEGEQKEWYRSGNLKSVKNYVSGLLHGIVEEYYDSSTRSQKSIRVYQQGKLKEKEVWDLTGKKKKERI